MRKKQEERFRDRLVQARPDLEEKRTIQPRGGKIDLMARVEWRVRVCAGECARVRAYSERVYPCVMCL